MKLKEGKDADKVTIYAVIEQKIAQIMMIIPNKIK